ncbi:L-serine ammonia-lyase, iron-sulfur-dependent, subunit alpha [Tissierella sp.]|uniref:L-cysteine desulfidase family protein n=1 Tax=Tissierella sp. TaxID=41274 RepID=UPI0028AC7A2F|nr:L-serine ammonia-lyase, iron-sulfur-dependent, subunit alpha [Tissierella sp.]
MINEEKKQYLLNIVKKETVPAIGCTEPVAVAYAAATGKKYIDTNIEKVAVLVSKSIFKNGKSVIIPNTEEWGLDLAAALGIIAGNPDDGLMVLKDVNKEHINLAHKLIEEGKITVGYLESSPAVYVEVHLTSKEQNIEVILKDSHNHIEMVKVNGEIVYKDVLEKDENISFNVLKEMTFEDIRKIVEALSLEDISFIKDGINMNKEAAYRGLNFNKGLNLGYTLNKLQGDNKLETDVFTKARILTAASADIRMGGGNCPIMTSAGSGNQGLGVVLPIVAVAEENNIEEEKLLKAVFFAHVVNKYIKIYTGKLSSMCGCAIAAGVGAAVGITWMLGGNDEQISGAAKNILSNLTGMICDGAKETCSFKLSTSAGEAVLSAYLALENVIVKPGIGIIGKDIEETIEKVGILCTEGLSQTDDVIIKLI